MSGLTGRLLVLLSFVALLGCASSGSPKKTQLQIREVQTRVYETPDVKLVLKAVFAVMQDEGYTVTQANTELGLLTATRDTDVDSMTERVAGWVLPFYGGNRSKTSILEATCNVTLFGSETKVRMNFHERVLNQKGLIKTIKGIDDPAFYQAFFSLLDKAIFLQKEKVGSMESLAEREGPRPGMEGVPAWLPA